MAFLFIHKTNWKHKVFVRGHKIDEKQQKWPDHTPQNWLLHGFCVKNIIDQFYDGKNEDVHKHGTTIFGREVANSTSPKSIWTRNTDP